MKLFNGSHDDSLGANWKGSLQSLHNPLNFKINPLPLLDSSSKNWKLQYRSKSCQVWYFKSITLDMFGMHSTMFRLALHFSKPIQLCSGYTPLRSGCVWLCSGWSKIFSECAGPVSCYARLCPGYDYFRTAPLEGFVPFNSFILTQSRWYSVRHNAGFPQFLSVSNSVSFYHVSISWPVCISFFSLINLTLVIIREHDICLVEIVFNTYKIFNTLYVELSTIYCWHEFNTLNWRRQVISRNRFITTRCSTKPFSPRG